MKLTRRQLVISAAAGSAVAVQALAQSTPSTTSASTTAPRDSGRDFGKEARDSVQRNAETLAKFELPQATEPAFQFKA